MNFSNLSTIKCLKLSPNFQHRTIKGIKPSSVIKTKDGIPFSIKNFTDIGLRPLVVGAKKKKVTKKKKKISIPEEKLPDVSKMTNPLKNIFTPEMSESERFEALGKLDFKITPGNCILLHRLFFVFTVTRPAIVAEFQSKISCQDGEKIT